MTVLKKLKHNTNPLDRYYKYVNCLQNKNVQRTLQPSYTLHRTDALRYTGLSFQLMDFPPTKVIQTWLMHHYLCYIESAPHDRIKRRQQRDLSVMNLNVSSHLHLILLLLPSSTSTLCTPVILSTSIHCPSTYSKSTLSFF